MKLLDFEKECLNFAVQKCSKTDISHDVLHAKRVLTLCKKISKKEGGNLKVLIPAALFHDIVIFPKDHKRSGLSQEKSAITALRFLDKNFSSYLSKEEINQVSKIISECSFSKNLPKTCLDGKILQDADGLEAIGAIAIMRTFTSGGLMNRPFYNEDDPFCERREPEALKYTLDLFFQRLLKIRERLSLDTSKVMALKREKIVYQFLKATKSELNLI